jgi:hypothetical protein
MADFFVLMNPTGNPGLSSAVQEALARRSGGSPTPQLSQVSPDARMANPGVPPPMASSQMTATSNPPAQNPTQSQKYSPQNQDDLIVMALIEHLKGSTQLQKEKMKLGQGQLPSTPQTPPQPQGATPESYLSAPSTAVMNQQANPLGGGF